MTRSRRVLWRPALAMLLPCAFIGLLGYNWLAVERDAAAHRSAESARALIARLRDDFVEHVLRGAPAAIESLDHLATTSAPFAQAPAWPAPISATFLFDRAGSLLSPNPPARYQAMVEAYRRTSADPAWQQALAHVHQLDLAGRTDDALTAARQLLSESREPGRRATALLALTRLSVAAQHVDDADRYASTIPVCCPAARDEYGVSFALYAAWQRATMPRRRADRDATLAAVVRETQDLVDRGFLGEASDSTQLGLLRTRIGARADLAAIQEDLDDARARWETQATTARAVARWLPRPDAPETAPAVGSLRDGPQASLVVFHRAPGDRWLAFVVSQDALAGWLATWPTAHTAFDVTVTANGDATAARATLTVPVFAEAPGLDLVVEARGVDPATDRRRRALFVAAVVAALMLTLLVGYFSVRDVSREVRTGQLRSMFVAGVTHELKTPLASIRLLAETLRSGRARPESTTELLDTIVAETDRLGRLVDNVLSSSRIESGTRAYDPRLVSLADVARSALRRFDDVLEKEGFHLVERIDDAHVLVRADADALGQSVLNLLGNAVKYSGSAREIEIAVGAQDGQAEIRIADRGIGIAPGEQERIFESFYRSPEAAAHTTGAGLGLALVRHFAEAHGGGVSVDSRPGEGSVFTLRLPIAPGGLDTHGPDSDR